MLRRLVHIAGWSTGIRLAELVRGLPKAGDPDNSRKTTTQRRLRPPSAAGTARALPALTKLVGVNVPDGSESRVGLGIVNHHDLVRRLLRTASEIGRFKAVG